MRALPAIAAIVTSRMIMMPNHGRLRRKATYIAPAAFGRHSGRSNGTRPAGWDTGNFKDMRRLRALS